MSEFGILFSIVLFFALLEAPLFTVIAALSIVCLYFPDHNWLSLQIVVIEMNRLSTVPVLTALPLFTFAGCLLTETRTPERMMRFLQAAVGRLAGGMAIASIGACVLFGALTGASGVTIVALGGILLPILLENDYDERFSLGLLTTSGSLGLLFPPSLPIILYGVVARVPIHDIFKAALLPGILSVALLAGYAFFHQLPKRRSASKDIGRNTAAWRRVYESFMAAAWDWPIILIIILGVYGGYATIAEVAALVVLYVVIVACFITKEVHPLRQLPDIIIESVILSGAVIIILGIALGFTGFLVEERIPNHILEALTALTENRLIFLGGLNVFLIVVGCLMDIFSAIIIIVPIIAPIAATYGISPIHLCIIFLVNLEIGYSTPPVGMNLFISSLRFHKPVGVLYRATLPYLALLLVLLLIVTYVPIFIDMGF